MKMYEHSYARQKVGVANPIESSELFNFIGEKKIHQKQNFVRLGSCLDCQLLHLLSLEFTTLGWRVKGEAKGEAKY